MDGGRVNESEGEGAVRVRTAEWPKWEKITFPVRTVPLSLVTNRASAPHMIRRSPVSTGVQTHRQEQLRVWT